MTPPNKNNAENLYIDLENLSAENSPLEGWQTQSDGVILDGEEIEIPLLRGGTEGDGVDSYNKTNSKIEEWGSDFKLSKSTSPSLRSGTPQRGELPTWKQNSLFPFWILPKNKELELKAKKLRKAGVLSETIFWQAFKNKKLLGFDIDRQVIIGNYIVDFFIPELGVVVEIDGESHDFKEEYDQDRENYLKSLGLEVVHYTDLEIKKSMCFVSDSFLMMVKKRAVWLRENPPRQPTAVTPSDTHVVRETRTVPVSQEGNFLLDKPISN
jgi:very-short-patch-repair endonuclease